MHPRRHSHYLTRKSSFIYLAAFWGALLLNFNIPGRGVMGLDEDCTIGLRCSLDEES